jgi:hypothetical protein
MTEIYKNNTTNKTYNIIKNNGETPNSDGEFVNILKSTTPNTDIPNTIAVTDNELASGYTKMEATAGGGRRKRRSQKNKSKRKRGRKSYRRRR